MVEISKQTSNILIQVSYKLVIESLIKYKQLSRDEAKRVTKSYLDPLSKDDRVKNLCDVYRHIAESLQNYGMRPNVIRLWEINNKFLLGFDHSKILDKYGNSNVLLRKAAKKKNPNVNINGKIWVSYSKGLLDAARWMAQFRNFIEFKHFVQLFNFHGHEGIKLLAKCIGSGRINGMKLAIALDVLKDLGLPISEHCSKPDVHVIKTLEGVKFIKTSGKQTIHDQIVAFDAIAAMSQCTGWTEYAIDKIIWLANSGKFYNDYDERFWPKNDVPKRRKIVVDEIRKRFQSH